MNTYVPLLRSLCPVDCEGRPIHLGDTVYCPDGWSNNKPNPWRPAMVVGQRTIVRLEPEKQWVLLLDGHDMREVMAYLVSLTPIHHIPDAGKMAPNTPEG